MQDYNSQMSIPSYQTSIWKYTSNILDQTETNNFLSNSNGWRTVLSFGVDWEDFACAII